MRSRERLSSLRLKRVEMINSYKKPEILAPCGSYDIMIAAINAGADACYFGGNKFGARAYATNFDLETSLKAIDYAHIHGSSLYLTVNTLFKDNEIDALYDYILPYYEAGLDAVIVQDLGVFRYIKNTFPDMHIHCSTQMNITSRHAAKAMKDMGASRIVTAREMSLEEITAIKNEVDVEIESFVHGAMCYSYSGRCLMSSLAGGRSGNRGRCAQPCRKCYDGEYILSMKDMCTLTDIPKLIAAGIDSLKIEGRMKNEYYVASAVDAYNQIAHDVVDGCYSKEKAEGLQYKLANIYNRGGFCGGYYFMHNGPEMISKDRPNNQGIKLGKLMFAKNGEIGIKLYQKLFKQDVLELGLNDGSVIEITSGVEADKNTVVTLKCPKTKLLKPGQDILRTRCNAILESVDSDIIKCVPKYELYGELKACVGEPVTLTLGRYVSDKYFQVCCVGDVVEESREREADFQDIRLKLNQLGNTCYTFADLALNVDKKAFVPSSVVKKLRRNAIEALEDKLCQEHRRKGITGEFTDKARFVSAKSNKPLEEAAVGKSFINIGVATFEQLILLREASYIDGVFLTPSVYKHGLRDGIIDILKSQGAKLYIELPWIINNNFDIKAYMSDNLPYDAIDGIYIRNIDGLFAVNDWVNAIIAIRPDFKVICGDGVYAYNKFAREFIEDILPVVCYELPRELNKRELYSLGHANNQLVVYEHQQVMLSAQCVVKNKLGCNSSNSLLTLKDDKSNLFYAQAVCDECCNIIYNGVPYMVLDQIDDDYIKAMGINALRINFTIEDAKRAREILELTKAYKQGEEVFTLRGSGAKYTSGHFNRGVE